METRMGKSTQRRTVKDSSTAWREGKVLNKFSHFIGFFNEGEHTALDGCVEEAPACSFDSRYIAHNQEKASKQPYLCGVMLFESSFTCNYCNNKNHINPSWIMVWILQGCLLQAHVECRIKTLWKHSTHDGRKLRLVPTFVLFQFSHSHNEFPTFTFITNHK